MNQNIITCSLKLPILSFTSRTGECQAFLKKAVFHFLEVRAFILLFGFGLDVVASVFSSLFINWINIGDEHRRFFL